MNLPTPLHRDLGHEDYTKVWERMRAFTDERSADTRDEIWTVEHPPVFTLGTNASREHVLAPGDIPVIQTDRGGQVTYHGPGQLVVYPLLDIGRLELGVRALVSAIELAVVDTLSAYGIAAAPRADAPGVYVDGAKIASIGLRVRRQCCYHGLAINTNLDLEPFARINPCGYAGLPVVDSARLGGPDTLESMRVALLPSLLARLGYNEPAPHSAPEAIQT